jgi:glutamine amidotransferase
MHNGGIEGWDLIKRKVQNSVSSIAFDKVQGNTDSEWAFAVFLSSLPDPEAKTFTTEVLRQAMLDTISKLNAFVDEVGARTEPSLMNFCVTDGETVIATRYVSSRTDEAASLWFSSGTNFSEYAEGGHYRMTKEDKRENIIMIASEPLTFEKADWMEIKTNHMAIITPRMNLLQIPIIDKYYVPPSHPDAQVRTSELANKKGLLAPSGHGAPKPPPSKPASKPSSITPPNGAILPPNGVHTQRTIGEKRKQLGGVACC